MKSLYLNHSLSAGRASDLEVSNLEVFRNKVGQWCCKFNIDRYNFYEFDGTGFTSWVINPGTKEKIEFGFFSKFLKFNLLSLTGGIESVLYVYVIPESEEEEKNIMYAEPAVFKKGWGFMFCLVPLSDFSPCPR